MRKMQIGSFFFLPSIAALAMLLAGCSTSTTTVVSQEVYNIVWLPNESNGMMAFIDKIYDNVDGSQSEGQNMYQVSSSGSLGNAMFPSDATPDLNYWNAPIISISPNGQTAIMQYGTDIYSVPVSGGNSTDIIQNTSLFGVSLDGKYAATTPTSANNAAYIFTTYDLATNPITINGQRKTIKGLLSNRVLWLNNNEYALTIYDSTGVDSIDYDHVAIFDSSGNALQIIPNGDILIFCRCVFAQTQHDLYAKSRARYRLLQLEF